MTIDLCQRALDSQREAFERQLAELQAQSRSQSDLLASLLLELNEEAYRWFDDHLRLDLTDADAMARYGSDLDELFTQPIRALCQAQAASQAALRAEADRSRVLAEKLVDIVHHHNFAVFSWLNAHLRPECTVADVFLAHPDLPVELLEAVSSLTSIEVDMEIGPQPDNGQPVGRVALDRFADDPALALLHLLGQSGEFLIARIIDLARSLPWAQEMSASSVRSRVYEHLNALQARGWLEQRDFDLRISNAFRGGIGRSLVVLTDAGRAAFQQHFGAAPVDELTPFVAKYKTVEAGLLIRLTQQIIEGWNSRPDRRWDVTALDAVWSDDEALARIPGAQRAYPSLKNTERALPDLILRMTPAGGGEPTLAVVEMERGLYKLPDLRAKWARAMRCYPPRMIYVVAPNTKTCKFLYQEWIEQVRLLRRRGELAHDVSAAFYTLDDLNEIGLLDAAQLVELDRRNRAHPEQVVRLPRYACEEKS